jgi:hypothetical protein
VKARWSGRTHLILLFLLSLGMVAVQGYHFGVDDGAIYIPAVEQFANPQLFPYGKAFFLSHGHMSIFSPLVGGTVRWLHVPVEAAVLGFHVLGVFLLLLAGYCLASVCFTTLRARWGATVTLACVLPTWVAGTALPIMDSYLTARTLSTPLTLLAVTAFLSGRRWATALLLLLTALLHPQMALYGVALLALLSLPRWKPGPARQSAAEQTALAAGAGLLSRMPAGFHLGAAQEPYRETLYSRVFFFAWAWTWYEWIGAIAPLGLLFLLARYKRPFVTPVVERLCRALLLLGLISTAAFLLFSSSSFFDNFVRLQPMRSLHLIYIVMFVLLGGIVGELWLKEKVWRWLLLFVPICIGMYAVDRAMYPASNHLELSARTSRNAWVQAFDWARGHTPQDAVFALPPQYMRISGEDTHGFRAVAERSMTADWVKDSGVASVFPQMAPEWSREQELTRGWETWSAPQFHALAERSPVSWVVVEAKQDGGLACPYHNAAVAVCRLRP